jgi:hypothetical protein
MKAITVKFYGPTNTRPARIVATAEGGHKFSIGAHSPEIEHKNSDSIYDHAAVELCKRLNWMQFPLVRGGLNAAGDRVYVMDAPECRIDVK